MLRDSYGRECSSNDCNYSTNFSVRKTSRQRILSLNRSRPKKTHQSEREHVFFRRGHNYTPRDGTERRGKEKRTRKRERKRETDREREREREREGERTQSNASIMTRRCEPAVSSLSFLFFFSFFLNGETRRDSARLAYSNGNGQIPTQAQMYKSHVDEREGRPRTERDEWDRPIIRILILPDTINQRSASGFYPHSLFRSPLHSP